MTTGRGFVTDKEIETLTKVVIDEIHLWRAIRAGALDDILYNRGVDFDEYDD